MEDGPPVMIGGIAHVSLTPSWCGSAPVISSTCDEDTHFLILYARQNNAGTIADLITYIGINIIKVFFIPIYSYIQH
jgi:hypothetical protein